MRCSVFQVDYKKNLEKYYLIFQEEKENRSFSYQEQMLINNKIPGILPLEIRYLNNVKFYYYEIDSRRSLTAMQKKQTFNLEFIKALISGVLNVILYGKEFLLEENDFILSADFIYLDMNNYKVGLCYYAGYSQNLHLQLTNMLEYVMNSVDYKDKEAVVFIYSLYMESKEESFTLSRLLAIITEKNRTANEEQNHIVNEKIQKTLKQCANQNNINISSDLLSLDLDQDTKENQYAVLGEKADFLPYPIWRCMIGTIIALLGFALIIGIYFSGILLDGGSGKLSMAKFIIMLLIILCGISYVELKVFAKKYRIYGKKNILKHKKSLENNSGVIQPITDCEEFDSRQEWTGNNPTVLLMEESKDTFSLIPKDPLMEPIIIRFFPFIIGKSELQADFQLTEDGISRIHAVFEQQEEQVYLIDRNSTNGTYVNQQRIKQEEKSMIQNGDEISFANTTFIFENRIKGTSNNN